LFELEQAAENQGTPASAEDREMVTSLIQEIRQPLSSIIGYTDLLMGESVGILGALQQKFLERIKTSSERMSILLEDLLQVSQIQNGSLELAIQPIELDSVVDQVVADLRNLIREKSLSLRVDFPNDLPKMNADRAAVQHIIMHLVQNAREVTPQDGTITIKSRVQKSDSGSPMILLQVTDLGGGVPRDELPRVFSGIYRADHALIPGIGDSGVGLSIAKTLVQALGGKIWVDSLPEKSTTFSVLFPVEAPQSNSARKAQ
jgi:signal transduction histidine kinase